MDKYEIKEFSDENLIEYTKLSSVMFKAKMPGICNEEEYINTVNNINSRRGMELVRLGAFHDGRLYAAIQMWGNESVFDGNRCYADGIGGVISDFNSPFKGGIPQLFTRAFDLMRRKKHYISHLYPFDEVYYRQFGYEVSAETAQWKLPVEKLMVKRRGTVVPYDGSDKMKEHIKEIHNSFSSCHNLSIYRSEPMWEKFFDEIKPYESGIFSFVHYNCDGKADAFMNYTISTYESKPSDIRTKSLWFTNLSALTGVLSYFGTQKAYCDALYITLPVNIDISPVINAKGGGGKRISERCVKNCGLTRVVDVEQVLKMAKYKGEGAIGIKIYGDDYAPWNNDVYTVSYGKETTVTRGGKADIEMKINSFSAGIMGRFDFENMALFDDVNIINDKSFENVFYKKPMWIEERF